MKTILSAIILITSFSSMAATNLTCGIFKDTAGGTPIKKFVMDLDQTFSKSSTKITDKLTIKAMVRGSFLTLSYNEPNKVTNTMYVGIETLKRFESTDSLGFVNETSGYMATVCYQTGDSDRGPWEL